jgi:hypothetical protein
MKKTIWFILGVLLALIVIMGYKRLPESKKRYIAYVAEQIPYLPARYFV